MNFTKEQINVIRNTKSVEELKELANTHGFEASDEQLEVIYSNFHNQVEGKISDDELRNVCGGSYCKNGQTFSDGISINSVFGHYLIVTERYGKNCKQYYNARGKTSHYCKDCRYSYTPGLMVMYCVMFKDED